MGILELIRTLSTLWCALAVKGELTTSVNINQALLGAAGGLCEISGLYYRPKDALNEDELVALLIVEQMEELVKIRNHGDQVKD